MIGDPRLIRDSFRELELNFNILDLMVNEANDFIRANWEVGEYKD